MLVNELAATVKENFASVVDWLSHSWDCCLVKVLANLLEPKLIRLLQESYDAQPHAVTDLEPLGYRRSHTVAALCFNHCFSDSFALSLPSF